MKKDKMERLLMIHIALVGTLFGVILGYLITTLI